MKKSWKTTTIGVLGALYLIVGLILVGYKVFTLSEFTESLSFVAVFLGAILAFFAKDSNVTGGSKQ